MQHAILITAYKNFDQILNLIDAFDLSCRCYIHIDAKSRFSERQTARLKEKANVDFVGACYTVQWGGVNHLRAIVMLLQEAYKDTKNEFFHLITGQDYPLKNMSDFNAFFENNKDKNYLEYNLMPYHKWDGGGFDRLIYYNFCDLIDRKSDFGRNFIYYLILIQSRLGLKRKFYKGFPTLYCGSTYWSLNRQCVRYVVEYMLANPKYLKRFNYTFCAEEFFFQSLIMSSPYKNTVVNDPLRYIVWEHRNGNFPANLDLRDDEAMFKSDAVFARKFESPVSDSLLAKVKKRINNK